MFFQKCYANVALGWAEETAINQLSIGQSEKKGEGEGPCSLPPPRPPLLLLCYPADLGVLHFVEVILEVFDHHLHMISFALWGSSVY